MALTCSANVILRRGITIITLSVVCLHWVRTQAICMVTLTSFMASVHRLAGHSCAEVDSRTNSTVACVIDGERVAIVASCATNLELRHALTICMVARRLLPALVLRLTGGLA